MPHTRQPAGVSRWIPILIGLIALTLPAPAAACRYTVRDVAFVDLKGEMYRLLVDLGAGAPASFADDARAAASGALAGTNVRLEIVEGASGGPGNAPAASLIAPDGRRLDLDLPADGAETLAAVRRLIEATAGSLSREEILDGVLEAHSVVLLVEGPDGAANRRAREIAEAAIEDAARGLSSLPKPIAHPPRLVALPVDSRAREKVLLFALGIEPRGAEAHLAVLSGRLRRMGEVLAVNPGEEKAAARPELSRALSMVGQDCECGLDRKWMEGVPLPHRWDEAIEARAAKALGFDPGNPLVKEEVAGILARGPSRRRASGPAAAAEADPLLGYREVEVDAPAEEPERMEFHAEVLEFEEIRPFPWRLVASVVGLLAGVALLMVLLLRRRAR